MDTDLHRILRTLGDRKLPTCRKACTKTSCVRSSASFSDQSLLRYQSLLRRRSTGHLPFTALDTTWNEGYTECEKSDFPKKGQRENRATQMVPF
jgi:hypothetical protein